MIIGSTDQEIFELHKRNHEDKGTSVVVYLPAGVHYSLTELMMDEIARITVEWDFGGVIPSISGFHGEVNGF